MQIAETERLIIREITMDDVNSLSVILSDKEVMKYSFRGVCSTQEIEQYVENCISNYSEYGFGQWAVIEKKSLRLIGVCGLNSGFDRDEGIIHLAARFAMAFWGKGFATEALIAVTDYAKYTLNLKSYYSLVEPDNVRSVKAVLSNDFTLQKETIYKGRALKYYIKLL